MDISLQTTHPEKETSFCLMWEIKEEEITAVVYNITSFQGRLLEYDGGTRGALIGEGALIEKSLCYPGRVLDTGS